jgi:riboflavin kinase/FMN adenylyltransferase
MFMHFLRPEYKFGSKKALINQLKKDEETVRALSNF